MKLLLILIPAAALAQNAAITTINTGDIVRNSVATFNNNFAALNTAKVGHFIGTGAPGSIPLNLPGDIYSDTTNGNLYWCAATVGTLAPACTSVTTGGWTKANGASPAGCTTAVQRNGGGVLAGDCNFTYDGTTITATPSGAGPIGTSTSTFTIPPLGSTRIFVDPNVRNSSAGNDREGFFEQMYFSGLNQPANYSNDIGRHIYGVDFNGNNATDNSDKRTKLGWQFNWMHRGSGQKAGAGINVGCSAYGDCLGLDVEVTSGGYANASGDEGLEGITTRVWQGDQQTGTIQSPAVTTTTCNTTINQGGGVAKSTGSTDIKTFTVVSTTGCNPGDLVSIDGAPWGTGSFSTHEVVKITAVGASTVSALLAYAHANSAPVQPAKYVTVDTEDLGTNFSSTAGYGQDRLVVLTSASPITAGNVTAVSCAGNACTFTGSGTSWNSLTTNGYCITLATDDFNYEGVGTRSVYYPINVVTSNTSIGVWNYNGKATSGTYSYKIFPCGQIAYLDLVGSSTSLTVQGMALFNTPTTWTVGGTFLQPINPWVGAPSGILSVGTFDGPAGPNTLGALFRAINFGTSEWSYGLLIDTNANHPSNTQLDYNYGIRIPAWTQSGVISLPGKDNSGTMIASTTYSGDDKCITWAGASHDASSICGGPTGTGAVINSAANKLKLANGPGTTVGPTFDYGSIISNSGTPTYTLPNASGTMSLVNPGPITVALPDTVGNAIEFGNYSLSNNDSDQNFDATISVHGGGFDFRAKSYRFSYRNDVGASGTWYTVAPLTDTGPSTSTDYRLDVEQDSGANIIHFRLTRTGGTVTGITAYVWLNQTGIGITWTQTSTTSTPSAPTAWWPTSVVGQMANKMTITNATGFVATVDPGNLTAARTITLPNWAGTPDYDGGSTFAISGCSATSPTGAATVGTYTSGTTGTCAVTVTMGDSRSATHGWGCSVYDMTTPADTQTITATNTTTVTFSGTTVSGDVVQFSCRPY